MLAQYSLTCLGGGMATVTAAGTAHQITATATPCELVTFRAISTNLSPCVVCNSTAIAAAATRVGLPIWAGSTAYIISVPCADLSYLYIDGSTGAAVSFLYYGVTVP